MRVCFCVLNVCVRMRVFPAFTTEFGYVEVGACLQFFFFFLVSMLSFLLPAGADSSKLEEKIHKMCAGTSERKLAESSNASTKAKHTEFLLCGRQFNLYYHGLSILMVSQLTSRIGISKLPLNDLTIQVL